ncbi:MAG: patatin-like phospholipase family protein [Mariprofundales bacterium]
MKLWRKLLGLPATGFVLVLSGGGGRGLAHLGVLQALEEEGMRPSAIIGCSIGSLFGAMYALHPNASDVQRSVLGFLESDMFQHLDLPKIDNGNPEDDSWLERLTSIGRGSRFYWRAFNDVAVADVLDLQKIVATLLADARFSSTSIPLYIVTTRFPSGDCHIFSTGDLTLAVSASMAIPGVFSPVDIAANKYLDGGLAAEIPTKEARMIAKDNEIIVAVNVGAHPDPKKEPENVLAMLDWASGVQALYLRRYEKEYADVLIEPLVGATQWHDFADPAREIHKGREAAQRVMPELRRILGR